VIEPFIIHLAMSVGCCCGVATEPFVDRSVHSPGPSGKGPNPLSLTPLRGGESGGKRERAAPTCLPKIAREWALSLAQDSDLARLSRLSARAAWVKCIAHRTHDWAETLQSKFCPPIFLPMPKRERGSSARRALYLHCSILTSALCLTSRSRMAWISSRWSISRAKHWPRGCRENCCLEV